MADKTTDQTTPAAEPTEQAVAPLPEDTAEDTDALDLLTDEERAAWHAEEGAEINGSASIEPDPAAWASSGWGKPEPKAEEPAPEPEPAAQADGEKPEPAAAEDQPAAAEDTAPPVPDDLPDYNEVHAKLSENTNKIKELRDSYKDGDLTDAEFDERMDALTAERDAVTADKARIDAYTAELDRAWKQTAREFVTERGFAGNTQAVGLLNNEVKLLSQDPAFARLSDRKILEAAHRSLVVKAEVLGHADAVPPLPDAAPKAAPKAEDAPAPAPAPAADPMRQPPKTLRDVPSSDVAAVDDGRFAALERLMQSDDPEVVENALAQMSEDERDRFASYAG